MIGSYDAAVIDQENGKPHIVKRMDRPYIRVVPEWFGGGTLPRKELHEAAQELTTSQAGLIAVGEPTIEKAVDQALRGAAKVVKHTMDATADEITSEASWRGHDAQRGVCDVSTMAVQRPVPNVVPIFLGGADRIPSLRPCSAWWLAAA
jgi:hypothetical protein